MIDIKGRGKIASKEMQKTKRATIKPPVLGAVSCGIPKYAEENIKEYVRFLRHGLVSVSSLLLVQTANPW